MDKQTRREFCRHGCQVASLAALAGALGAILEGCGGGSGGGNPASPSGVAALPIINANVTNNAIALTIDSSSPLAAVGSAALVQTASVSVLVARTAQSAFAALSALCTHQACTITGWGNQTFVCPCHGSQFDTSGRVLGGPAPLPLHQYQTQFSNNVLTITG